MGAAEGAGVGGGADVPGGAGRPGPRAAGRSRGGDAPPEPAFLRGRDRATRFPEVGAGFLASEGGSDEIAGRDFALREATAEAAARLAGRFAGEAAQLPSREGSSVGLPSVGRGDWTELDRFLARLREGLAPYAREGRFGGLVLPLPRTVAASGESFGAVARIGDRLEGLRLLVEPRHPSWAGEEALGFLRGIGAGLVLADGPDPEGPALGPDRGGPRPLTARRLAPFAPVTAEVAYVRFHGRDGELRWAGGAARRDYLYSWEELVGWLPALRALAARGRDLHIVFNNPWRGRAIENARMMRRLIGYADEARQSRAGERRDEAAPAPTRMFSTPGSAAVPAEAPVPNRMFSTPGEVVDAGQPVAGVAPVEPGGADLPGRMFSTPGSAAVPAEAPVPNRMFSTLGEAVDGEQPVAGGAPAEPGGADLPGRMFSTPGSAAVPAEAPVPNRMFSTPELVGLFADGPALLSKGPEGAEAAPDIFHSEVDDAPCPAPLLSGFDSSPDVFHAPAGVLAAFESPESRSPDSGGCEPLEGAAARMFSAPAEESECEGDDTEGAGIVACDDAGSDRPHWVPDECDESRAASGGPGNDEF